jgi:hypothetical protein
MYATLSKGNQNTSVFWDIVLSSPFKSTDISEEHVVSVFRAEE